MSEDSFASPTSTLTSEAAALRERARMASNFGMISIVLCLLMPCASCLSLMAAIPLALVAVQYGRGVLAQGPDEVAEVQARHGMITGIIALVYAGLVLSAILAYLLLYFGLIAAVVAGGI